MKRYTIYKDTKKETGNRKYGQWTRDRKEVRDRVYVRGAWCVECGVWRRKERENGNFLSGEEKQEQNWRREECPFYTDLGMALNVGGATSTTSTASTNDALSEMSRCQGVKVSRSVPRKEGVWKCLLCFLSLALNSQSVKFGPGPEGTRPFCCHPNSPLTFFLFFCSLG